MIFWISMKNNFSLLILLLISLLLIACSQDTNHIFIKNDHELIKITVEIADNEAEIAKGLMFRESLPEFSGMLFEFENEEFRTFWMKNTLIPLDMIFIDGEFRIVDIHYAVPCKLEHCAVYKSSKPAKYVLEVNGNFTKRKSVKVGDRIEISFL